MKPPKGDSKLSLIIHVLLLYKQDRHMNELLRGNL